MVESESGVGTRCSDPRCPLRVIGEPTLLCSQGEGWYFAYALVAEAGGNRVSLERSQDLPEQVGRLLRRVDLDARLHSVLAVSGASDAGQRC